MPSSDDGIGELEVYKMLARLGIDLGAGVIPRYGLMYIGAVRACRSCASMAGCMASLRSGMAPAEFPETCPNAEPHSEFALPAVLRARAH